MTTPEYNKRADREYRKKCKQYNFLVRKDIDGDIIAKLDSVDNRTEYIKQLIRGDQTQWLERVLE